MRFVLRSLVVTGLLFGVIAVPRTAVAESVCELFCPVVDFAPGTLTASHLERAPGNSWVASNAAPDVPEFRYQLSRPCVVNDRETETCTRVDFVACPAPPGRVVQNLIIERQRLVQPDGTAAGLGVPAGTPPGSPVGPWEQLDRGCVDVTALNPPPSPDEVFRYFQTLPLPQLPTRQQPPGDALVGLPVIFFTDGPTTQTFTLDIRGFTVDIVATATGFTWRTGDGTQLTSTDPGAPYPDHTISHDYASGTYTASLTTTWSGSFSVDDGLALPVPGSTTTDGPPVTFAVLQARPVLTNPFD